jgi:hypothetical protein
MSWAIPAAFADVITSSTLQHGTLAAKVVANATIAAPQTRIVNASFRAVLPTTTTTTSPPPPPPTPTRPVTTTTTRPAPPPAPPIGGGPPPPGAPPPTPVAPPPPPQNVMVGGASWYGAPAGTCASPTLAFGTVVTVTALSSGASVRCTVDDREANTPGRVLDLAPATFSQLASLSVGVVEVRLTW